MEILYNLIIKCLTGKLTLDRKIIIRQRM